jgi:hypothetical protein
MKTAITGRTRVSSGLALVAILAVAVSACALLSGPRPLVWVDNRSSEVAAIFVTDLGDGPAGWFIVPAHTTAHAGSDGLGSPDVRVNLLGWRHEAGNVSECSPGNYDDTLYDVPRGASVRLLIEADGRPSVSLMEEPAGLPDLEAQTVMNTLNEADLCEYFHKHSPQ